MAQTLLLPTKLYIPPAPVKLVARPRLFEQLNTGMQRKLTLISAAGFGKSTLLSEWIRQNEIQATWLTLEAADNDPALFLRYVIAALQTLYSDVGQATLSLLEMPQPPPFESMF